MRVQNVSSKAECAYCQNDGYVVVEGPHDGYDCAYAPCPHCEQGFAEEFPDLTGKDKAARIRPPWGEGGYWRDKDRSILRPRRQVSLSKAEQAEHLRAAKKSLGFIVKPL